MDSETSFTTAPHEKLSRRQDSFQEAFQIYEPFEVNSDFGSPILSVKASSSQILDHDNLKSDSTLLSGNSASLQCDKSKGSSGKANKKRATVRPNHTPRPPNSFILYRRDKHTEILLKSNSDKGLNNNAISRVVADMWKNESLEVKGLYKAKADEEKRMHLLKYPNYKYQPRKNKKSNADYFQKPKNQSNSLAPIISTVEDMHPSGGSFEDRFSSPWSHTDDSFNFQSQFSFTKQQPQKQQPQTFYESRSIGHYTLIQMEPNDQL